LAAFGATGAGARRRPSEEPLLGSVDRPGIGRQVTYAGHPLYLFDGPAALFQPYGEDYPETGAPMEPWHGVWYLVSAHGGQPAPGRATIETGALPDGKMVVAAQEFPNVSPTAVTVYSFSRDGMGASVCTGACAVTWVPVLTTGTPRVKAPISTKDVGVVRRADGTNQVTYEGKPLYVFSSERFVFSPGGPPPSERHRRQRQRARRSRGRQVLFDLCG
jgi:predicted lipoprotein with Yx(FWY)xxD motif